MTLYAQLAYSKMTNLQSTLRRQNREITMAAIDDSEDDVEKIQTLFIQLLFDSGIAKNGPDPSGVQASELASWAEYEYPDMSSERAQNILVEMAKGDQFPIEQHPESDDQNPLYRITNMKTAGKYLVSSQSAFWW